MKIKSFFIITIVLFSVWVLLNNSYEPVLLIIGAAVSILIALIFCTKCSVFSQIKLSPKSLFYSIAYLFVFMIELIKSNLDVAIRVISPKLPINPGIVKVKTVLNTELGRMILANSITLTPGTLSVDIRDEYIYVHWINVEGKDIETATNSIVKKFEKYLKEIYG
ncbi:MAG: Na+/H+ antiporter subunit E [Bacteroidales bacterium]|nr:Na+/H+ antiporter subunit E [Bacteroidales bacterium]